MDRAIAYFRISTQRQDRSGLGIEAQGAGVARFTDTEGITILHEFTEVETGKAPMRSTADRSWQPRLPLLARQNVLIYEL